MHVEMQSRSRYRGDIGEVHVEIEVEAAVIVDREVAEQVDALYRRVRQGVEEGLPRRAPAGRYGGDAGEI